MVTNTQVDQKAIVSAQITASIREELRRRAEQAHRSPSAEIRTAIREHVRRETGRRHDRRANHPGRRASRRTRGSAAPVSLTVGPLKRALRGASGVSASAARSRANPFIEPLGVMSEPLSGYLALGHLGRTFAERAGDRARARAATVDAVLAGPGVRAGRRRVGL
jgi:hypothetical protein